MPLINVYSLYQTVDIEKANVYCFVSLQIKQNRQ